MRAKIVMAVLLLIISFIIAWIYYANYYYKEVTAEQLANQYTVNKIEADKNYLDKNVEVKGKVKAFYKLLGVRKVLELQTSEDDLPVLCFFLSEQGEYKAKEFQENDEVILKGKCVGTEAYSYVKGVKIEVEKIK